MADAKGAYIGGVPVQFKDAVARAMISDEYNSAETYAKGNLCIYNGKIYEAIKETTGTWDATAWEETTLAKVNGKLNGDITKLKENKWQLFGTRTGSNSLNIKELIQTGKEIRVIVEAQYSSSSANRIKLVYNPSPENIGIFTSGYCYSSNNYVTVAITINADGMVYIASFWWKVMENANTTIPLNDTTATLKVYYR